MAASRSSRFVSASAYARAGIGLAFLLASAGAANAATLTYSGVGEAMRVEVIATGSQGGGVLDVDTRHATALQFVDSIGRAVLDNDTQTGTVAVAQSTATQITTLGVDRFDAAGGAGYSLLVANGGQASADAFSTLEFSFVSDEDLDVLLGSSVICQGAGCEASVQLFGPLGTGALIDLSVQDGVQSSDVTARILAGSPYFVTIRGAALHQVTGDAHEGGGASWSISMTPQQGGGGVPEPSRVVLLASGLVGLTWLGRKRSRPSC